MIKKINFVIFIFGFHLQLLAFFIMDIFRISSNQKNKSIILIKIRFILTNNY